MSLIARYVCVSIHVLSCLCISLSVCVSIPVLSCPVKSVHLSLSLCECSCPVLSCLCISLSVCVSIHVLSCLCISLSLCECSYPILSCLCISLSLCECSCPVLSYPVCTSLSQSVLLSVNLDLSLFIVTICISVCLCPSSNCLQVHVIRLVCNERQCTMTLRNKYLTVFLLLLPLCISHCVSLLPLSGSALGLLLVFRTNTAYNRFWEGRRIWERILTSLRDLGRMTVVYGDVIESTRVERILHLLCAFPLGVLLSIVSVVFYFIHYSVLSFSMSCWTLSWCDFFLYVMITTIYQLYTIICWKSSRATPVSFHLHCIDHSHVALLSSLYSTARARTGLQTANRAVKSTAAGRDLRAG